MKNETNNLVIFLICASLIFINILFSSQVIANSFYPKIFFDLNLNSKIELTDAIIALKKISQSHDFLEENKLKSVNSILNQNVNLNNVITTLQIISGLISFDKQAAIILSIQDNSGTVQTQVPVSAKCFFNKGDVPATKTLYAQSINRLRNNNNEIPVQMNNVLLYDDGSVKNADITFILPHIEPNIIQIIELIPSDKQLSNKHITLEEVLDTGYNSTIELVQNNISYVASLEKFIQNNTVQKIFSGPICSKWHISGSFVTTNVVNHNLNASFDIIAYEGCERIRLDVCIQNKTSSLPEPAFFYYDLTMSLGATQFVRKNLSLHPFTSWTKIMWWGQKPLIDIYELNKNQMNTNNHLSISINNSGEIDSIMIDKSEFLSEKKSPIWIRDLTNINQSNNPNLSVNLSNSDFETSSSLADIVNDWSLIKAIDPDRIEMDIDLKQGYLSNRSLFFRTYTETFSEGTTVAALMSEPVSVTENTLYRVGCYVKSKAGYLYQGMNNPPYQQLYNYKHFNSNKTVTGIYIKCQNRKTLSENIMLAVPISGNIEDWRLFQREFLVPKDVNEIQIILSVRLMPGETVWFDKILLNKNDRMSVPLLQKPEIKDDGSIEQTFKLNQEKMDINVSYKVAGQNKDHILISGIVKDYSSSEKVFDLIFKLPINAIGWNFGIDAHSYDEINVGIYENAISSVSHAWHPISLYPYLGIGEFNQINGRGIVIALPPDIPQNALLRYNADTQTLEAIFHLAVSPKADKLKAFDSERNATYNSSEFKAMLFYFDSEWGFRNVIKKYCQISNENYGNPFENKINFMDYNLEYKKYEQITFSKEKQRETIAQLNENKVFVVSYSMSEFWIPLKYYDNNRINISQAEEIISDFSLDNSVEWIEEPTLAGGAYYDSRTPLSTIQELSKCVMKSSALDENYNGIINQISKKTWAQKSFWESIWSANIDPDIPQGLGRWLLTRRVYPIMEKIETSDVQANGMMLDCLLSTPVIDHRPDAIQNIDKGHPLTYDPLSYKAGVHTSTSVLEYLKKLRQILDKEPFNSDIFQNNNKVITANVWGIGTVNSLVNYIDYYGGEGQGDSNDGQGQNWNFTILNYRRAIAYHKKIGFSQFKINNNVGHFLALAKLYGIKVISDNENILFEKTSNLMNQYCYFNWDPIPYAITNNQNIRIERFENKEDAINYLSVYNSDNKNLEVLIVLDTRFDHFQRSNLSIENIESTIDNNGEIILSEENGFSFSYLIPSKRTIVFKISPIVRY
ncbi:conserved hypothetical protein, secreted [Candidatus Magnetomorum sp. HK-1]|nr:conserved hypothetical protein, secreted [Candidatus Magnetomorum sp. HK-1]